MSPHSGLSILNVARVGSREEEIKSMLDASEKCHLTLGVHPECGQGRELTGDSLVDP